jgi:hypothetical protein
MGSHCGEGGKEMGSLFNLTLTCSMKGCLSDAMSLGNN